MDSPQTHKQDELLFVLGLTPTQAEVAHRLTDQIIAYVAKAGVLMREPGKKKPSETMTIYDNLCKAERVMWVLLDGLSYHVERRQRVERVLCFAEALRTTH